MREATDWLEHDPVGRVVLLLICALAIMAAVKILQRFANIRIADRDFRYRTRKLIVGAGYVAFAIACVIEYGPRTSNFTVVAGLVSAGLAFALQEVITSFAGYIAISFGGFFHIGDRVEFGGIKGDVVDVSALRTTLVELGEWVHSDLYTGRVVRVTNGFIFKQPVYNYSGDFRFLWDEFTLPVSYDSDHRLTRSILSEVATDVTAEFVERAKNDWTSFMASFAVRNEDLTPVVTLVVTSNYIEFTVRYLVPYESRRRVRDAIFTRVFDRLQENRDKIQLGSTTMAVTVSQSAPKGSP